MLHHVLWPPECFSELAQVLSMPLHNHDRWHFEDCHEHCPRLLPDDVAAPRKTTSLAHAQWQVSTALLHLC